MLNLPPTLIGPIQSGGRACAGLVLDLTVYLDGPSETELEFLLEWYERTCPPTSLLKYKIAEFTFWTRIAYPELTASGRAAAAVGVRRPHLEPVRKRIRDGRAFEVQLWDGIELGASQGSWSFSCRAIHLRTTGLHAFVRILLPITADPEILVGAAVDLADNVRVRSGHGGLAFGYETSRKESAFDAIYPLARRYWGIDVEHLNGTLPLMKNRIKGSNWITMLGRDLLATPGVAESVEQLPGAPDITVAQQKNALVIVAGKAPAVGDQQRTITDVQPYIAVAQALQPLFLDAHPDFPGQRFVDNGNTIGWVRRFLEPAGWR